MATTATLDDDSLDSLATVSTSLNDHLSFPSTSNEASLEQLITPQQPRPFLQDRLYIGNLHPTVDEYTLLQIFSKFGKVTKLDFLFHRAGVMKGKPRGYAFVEYGNKDEAQKALTMAHQKHLRGRKLIVTFAHQVPLDQPVGGLLMYGTTGAKHRKGMMEIGRPTTLSMLKTGLGGRNDATKDKIAMMEAKLRQMEGTNPTSSLSTPLHPSLPAKPPPPLPTSLGIDRSEIHSTSSARNLNSRSAITLETPLLSLPILSRSQLHSPPDPKSVAPRQIKSSKLIGVKIVKFKEKTGPAQAG